MPVTDSAVVRERPVISVKRQPFGMFPAESPSLFVPHPDMWLVHDASTPEAVAEQAGLSKRIFDHWRREHSDKPWLLGWLYGDDPPEAKDFPFSDAMHKFRKETQVKAISEATGGRRTKDETWVGSQERTLDKVDVRMINYWRSLYREKYPDEEWFERWLLRGQDPPPRIKVVAADDARRCAAAWDYLWLAEDAGIESPQVTYSNWFDRSPSDIPGGEARLPWLLWLYRRKGYRHAPAFVVTPKLQVYRRRGTVKAIINAAKLRKETVLSWRRDQAIRNLLEEAIQAARQGGKAGSEEFRRLPPHTQAGMHRYAALSTKAARCRDEQWGEGVGPTTGELDTLLREANEQGVKQDLLDYLEYEGAYGGIASRRQRGLLNGKLFVATQALCDFHERAVKEWSKQRISELEQLPGFDNWFLSWVVPQKGNLRGRIAANDAVKEVATQPDGVASSPEDRTGETSTGRERGTRETRKKRSRDKHLRWKQLRDEGKSYGDIVLLHKEETDEVVTREAVIHALNRLPPEC